MCGRKGGGLPHVEGWGVDLDIVEHEGMPPFGEWLRGNEKGSLDNKAAWIVCYKDYN